ncbi:LysR substrate-binding domain-containing protein [Sciscionella marina]|uniref:LysR substrate-binding domain-containing protein n=1 Tax=Sciscionella marina TaxID=508770 RepID=UPI0003A98C90|nr:LysR substrate-binding domain-containing protein [Sciscionella marina]
MDIPRLLDGRMKLRHLVLVDALTEEGSVLGAAAALRLTQPALTRGLHELESILGVPLYDRGARGVTPTIYGVAFTEQARAVIAQLRQAARHIAEIADADRGTVVIGSHLTGATLLLPKAITALKTDHPHLTIEVREGSPETLLVDLVAGRLDVVVGRVTAPSNDAVVRHLLYEEPVQIVVGAHHPAREQADITLTDLLDYPWILPSTQTRLRRDLEDYFVRHRLGLPVNRVETTSFLTMRQLLIDSDVVAVLPSPIDQGDPSMAVLPVHLEGIGHTVGLTLAAERPLNPATTAMVQHLRQSAQRLNQAQ